MIPEIKKYRKHEPYEGFQISQQIIDEPGQKILREFIPVIMVELMPPRIIIHTRKDRLAIAAGSWILKNNEGRFQVVNNEDFEKNFELITE